MITPLTLALPLALALALPLAACGGGDDPAGADDGNETRPDGGNGGDGGTGVDSGVAVCDSPPLQDVAGATVVAEVPFLVNHIAVDATDVYFLSGDDLWTVPRSGGCAVRLADLEIAASSNFLVDRGADLVVGLNASGIGSGLVVAIDKADGERTDLLDDRQLFEMAGDTDDIYALVSSPDGPEVLRLGATQEVVISAGTNQLDYIDGSGLEVDASRLYLKTEDRQRLKAWSRSETTPRTWSQAETAVNTVTIKVQEYVPRVDEVFWVSTALGGANLNRSPYGADALTDDDWSTIAFGAEGDLYRPLVTNEGTFILHAENAAEARLKRVIGPEAATEVSPLPLDSFAYAIVDGQAFFFSGERLLIVEL